MNGRMPKAMAAQARATHARIEAAAASYSKRPATGLPAEFIGFYGERAPEQAGGLPVWMIDGAMVVPLDPRNDVRNHSPDGFQWGYGGSGPAQLALAICCSMVGKDRAVRVYQDFKWRVIGHLGDTWHLSRVDAMRIIDLIEGERESGARDDDATGAPS